MPRCLLVQVQRYYFGERWMPCKMDCCVCMPDTLDMEPLRGKGLQPVERELRDTSATQDKAADTLNPEEVQVLVGMGMSERNVRAALKAKGSLDAAMGWLLGQEDVDAAVAQLEREAEGAREEPEDGAEKYALVGFISHIGRNTGSGHYVCHLQKEANPVFGEIAVSPAGHRERQSSRRSTRRSRILKMGASTSSSSSSDRQEA